MKSNIIFCTGGTRSGKSSFLLGLANKIAGTKLFVATAEGRDQEMQQRINKHRAERGAEWLSLEVPVAKSCHITQLLSLALSQPENGKPKAILLDCLSTWVSACQESWSGSPSELESGVLNLFDEFLASLLKLDIPVFVVSAEVGMGLVAPSAEVRQFCDLLGAVNQHVAHVATEAYFCVSGMSMKIK